MKPVTHHITLFTPDRIAAIRLARELGIHENRAAARKRTPSSTKSKPKSKRKTILDSKARAALEGADPALQAFLKANMNL